MREFAHSESDSVSLEGPRLALYSPSMKPQKVSDRVRARLKEELIHLDISQRALADALSKQTDEYWTQSKVGKVLNGHVELKIDDVDAISKVARIYLTEAVRDRGLEFYAEMSPTELRILERMRQRPNVLHAVMLLLDMDSLHKPEVPVAKPKRGRPLKSSLT